MPVCTFIDNVTGLPHIPLRENFFPFNTVKVICDYWLRCSGEVKFDLLAFHCELFCSCFLPLSCEDLLIWTRLLHIKGITLLSCLLQISFPAGYLPFNLFNFINYMQNFHILIHSNEYFKIMFSIAFMPKNFFLPIQKN